MKKRWSMKYVCRQGLQHIRDGTACQDAVAAVYQNGVYAIALADGAGSAEDAAKGAEITANTLIQMMTQYFFEWEQMSREDAQAEFLIRLKEPLYRYAAGCNITISDLGSTAVGAVIYEDRFMIVHLGDGYIFYRKKGDWRIMSFPENGIGKKETVLTSSFPAVEHLRIHFGSMDHIDGICICSDGWQGGLEKMEEIQNALNGADSTAYSDDISAVQLLLEGIGF